MFTLARELGMTVGELGQKMSSLEFSEWQALAIIEQEEHQLTRQQTELDIRAQKNLQARKDRGK